MRAAPPVDALLAEGRRERLMIVLAYSLAAAVFGHWLAATRVVEPSLSLVLPAALAGAALGLAVARHLLPPGIRAALRWTGVGWQWGDRACQRVDLHLDLGGWMLLRLVLDQRARRWVIADAGSCGGAWRDLRIALRAHGGALAVRPEPDARAPQEAAR